MIGGSVTLSNDNAVGTEITATLSEDALIKEGSWTWERSKSLASGWEKITDKDNVDTDQTISKYTPKTEDARYYIRVTFNVTPDKNFKGSVSETTSTVIREALTEVKIYKGDQEVTEADMVAHNLLRAEVTPNGFESDVTFEWYHDGDNTIQGVGKEYLLSGKDIDKTIYVKAIPRSDGGVSNEITSAITAVVKKAPLATPTYSIKLVSYTDTSLTVNLPGATSGLYRFEYLEAETTDWKEWNVNARSNNSITIRGLNAKTVYKVRYKQIGENGYEDSSWTNSEEFKTDLPHIKGNIEITGEAVFGQQLDSSLMQGEDKQQTTTTWYIVDNDDPSKLSQVSTERSYPNNDPDAIGHRLKVVYRGQSTKNWAGEVSAMTEIIKKATVSYPGNKTTTYNSYATGPYTIHFTTPKQNTPDGTLSDREKFIIGYSLTKNGVPIEYSENSVVKVFEPEKEYDLKGFQRNTTYYFFLRYAETNTHYKSDWQPISMSTEITTEKDPIVGSINFTYESVIGKPIQGEKLIAYLDGVNAASGTWSWTRIPPNGGAEETINNYYPDGNDKTYIIVPTDEEPGTNYKVVFTPEEGYSGTLDNTSEPVQKFVLSPYVTPSVPPIISETIAPTDTTLTFKMPDTASEGAVYEFKYGTVNNVINENNKVVITKAYKNTDVTITGLNRNKTYYIWVRQVGDDTHSDSEWFETPLTLSTIQTDIHGYVTITDTPVANEELTATYTSANYIPDGKDTKDGTWQWYRANGSDWLKIENATTDKYTPTSDDINKQLKAVYTGGGDFKDSKSAISDITKKAIVTNPEITGFKQIDDNAEGLLNVEAQISSSSNIWYRLQKISDPAPTLPTGYTDDEMKKELWTKASSTTLSLTKDYNNNSLTPDSSYMLYIMQAETGTTQPSNIISSNTQVGQLTQRGTITYSGNEVVTQKIKATLEGNNNTNGTWKWYVSTKSYLDGQTTAPSITDSAAWTQISGGYYPSVNSEYSELTLTEEMFAYYVRAEFVANENLSYKGTITGVSSGYIKKIYDETLTLSSSTKDGNGTAKGYANTVVTGTVSNYVDNDTLDKTRSSVTIYIDTSPVTTIKPTEFDKNSEKNEATFKYTLPLEKSYDGRTISAKIDKPKNYQLYVNKNFSSLTNDQLNSNGSNFMYKYGTPIATADDLYTFMNKGGVREGNYIITKNIDASGLPAIGQDNVSSLGANSVFDGDFHTIRGLNNFLFYSIGSNAESGVSPATVKNLILMNSNLDFGSSASVLCRNASISSLEKLMIVDSSVKAGWGGGYLIGRTLAENTNISEVFTAGGTAYQQGSEAIYSSVGALVGGLEGNATISDISTISTVVGEIGRNANRSYGGLVGYIKQTPVSVITNPTVNIKNSLVASNVTATVGKIGPIVGDVGNTATLLQTNLYYDSNKYTNVNNNIGNGKNTSALAGNALANQFGSEKWTYHDGYYPRLKWLENNPIAILYTATNGAFIPLASNVTATELFNGIINGPIKVPSELQKSSYSYTSSNTSILKVTDGGTIIPVGNEGQSADITITYTEPDMDVGGVVKNKYTFKIGKQVSSLSSVSISGDTKPGRQLTATVSPATNVTYQWYKRENGKAERTAIKGATGSTYMIQPDDVGTEINVDVTAYGYPTSSNYTTMITSVAPTGIEPTNLTDNSVDVKAKGIDGANYEYAYAVTENGKKTIVGQSTSTFTISGLSRNKDYWLYARVAGAENGSYEPSEWSSANPIKTLKTDIAGPIIISNDINMDMTLSARIADTNMQKGEWKLERIDSNNNVTSILSPTSKGAYDLTYKLTKDDVGSKIRISYAGTGDFKDPDGSGVVSIETKTILNRVQTAPTSPTAIQEGRSDHSLSVKETDSETDTTYEFGYNKKLTDEIMILPGKAATDEIKSITDLDRNTTYYVYARKAAKTDYEASPWSGSVQITTLRTNITSNNISVDGVPKVDETLTFTLNSLDENTKDQTGLWVLERVKGSETNTLIPTTTNDGKITYKVVPEDSGSEIKATFVGTGDYEGRTDISTNTVENASQEIGAIKPTIVSMSEYSIKVKVADASSDIFEFGYQKLDAGGKPEGDIIAYPITVAWGNNLDINPQDIPLTRDTGYQVYVRKAAKVGYNNSDWSSAVSTRTQKSALKGNVKLVSGTTAIGQTLEVTYEKGSYPDNADDTGGTWQWYIGDQKIPDATGSSYTVAATEDNPEISVIYTAKENSGFTGSVSRNFGAVHKDPYPVPAAAEATAKDSDNAKIGSVITVTNSEINDVYIYLRESSNSKLPELVKASEITNTELSNVPEENIERWIPAKASMDILVPANRSYVIYSARLTSGTNEASGISSTRGTTSAKEPLLRSPETDGQIKESDANVPWKALQAKTLEYSLMGTIAPTASWKYYVRPDSSGKWQNIDSELDTLGRVDGISEDQTKALSTISLPLKYTGYQLRVELTGIDDYEGTVTYEVSRIEGKLIDAGGASIIKSDTTQIFDVLKAKYSGTDKAPGSFTWYRETFENSGVYEIVSADGKITEDDSGSNYQTDVNDYKKRIYAVYTASPESEYSGTSSTDMVLVSEKANQNQPDPVIIKQVNGNSIQVIAPNNYVTANMDTIPDVVLGYAKCDEDGTQTSSITWQMKDKIGETWFKNLEKHTKYRFYAYFNGTEGFKLSEVSNASDVATTENDLFDEGNLSITSKLNDSARNASNASDIGNGIHVTYTGDGYDEGYFSLKRSNGEVINAQVAANVDSTAKTISFDYTYTYEDIGNNIIVEYTATDAAKHYDGTISKSNGVIVTKPESKETAETPTMKRGLDTDLLVKIKNGYEYCLNTSMTAPAADSGDWNILEENKADESGYHDFLGLERTTTYYLHARIAETKETQASEAVTSEGMTPEPYIDMGAGHTENQVGNIEIDKTKTTAPASGSGDKITFPYTLTPGKVTLSEMKLTRQSDDKVVTLEGVDTFVDNDGTASDAVYEWGSTNANERFAADLQMYDADGTPIDQTAGIKTQLNSVKDGSMQLTIYRANGVDKGGTYIWEAMLKDSEGKTALLRSEVTFITNIDMVVPIRIDMYLEGGKYIKQNTNIASLHNQIYLPAVIGVDKQARAATTGVPKLKGLWTDGTVPVDGEAYLKISNDGTNYTAPWNSVWLNTELPKSKIVDLLALGHNARGGYYVSGIASENQNWPWKKSASGVNEIPQAYGIKFVTKISPDDIRIETRKQLDFKDLEE